MDSFDDWYYSVVSAFLYFAPILVANQGSGLARGLLLPLGSTPVSRRYLGENKTVAAYYAGPLLSMLMYYLYGNPTWWYYGGIVGLGTVLGDHTKSFFKRLLGMPPGTLWFFDRIDFAIGGCIATKFCFPHVEWEVLFLILVMAFFVHLVGNYASFRFGLGKTPH